MMVNEFADTIWECAVAPAGSTTRYNCMFPSDLQAEGKIRGTAVLEAYNYGTHRTGEWAGIMICIIVAYRILGYVVLRIRKI